MTTALTFSSTNGPLSALANRKRWLALVVVCFGVLMIVVDTTVVNVALPSIRKDLKFTESSLVWVVNAYMLTFGGSLLLGGRLGDLYGHRKLFLVGIVLFTVASFVCGLANSQMLLVAARSAQGLGGAVVMAVALSVITNTFTDAADRAKAMGVYSFVCAGGAGIGLLVGGVLTSKLNWHWVFLVNLPIGVAVCALCLPLLPNMRAAVTDRRLDLWGAVTVTASLMLAVCATVKSNEVGWTSSQTLNLLAGAAAMLGAFILIEARVPTPLIPLGIFSLRNLTICNTIGILWAVSASTWFFISALYMQLVLGYGPLQVGLAFLPANVITGVFALGMSAKFVARFGLKKPLCIGLLLISVSLALFARVPIDGGLEDILPGMVLLGLGSGIGYNPLMLAAMSDVAPGEVGLASGLVNTGCMMGGALGLAVVVSLATTRTNQLLASGAAIPVALTGGYRLAFLLGVVCATTAALFGAAFLRRETLLPKVAGPPGHSRGA